MMSRHWKISTGRHFQNGHHKTTQIQHCPISMTFDMWGQPFWKWQISRKCWKCRIAPLMVTYHYVKFYVSIIIYLEVININVRNFKFPVPEMVKIQHCLMSSKFDMWVDNDVPNWFLTLKNFYRSPFSKNPQKFNILKMATGRNFSMSGINSRHHYLPTYQILMISDNVEFLRYCVWKWQPVEIFQR
jgi:hypothetical protein